MERIKAAAKELRLFPKLQLGEMRQNEKGNEVFYPDNKKHTIKLTAEPTTTAVNKNGKTIKAFKFIVEEDGELKKWIVPLWNDQNEGHYLIDRLNTMGVEVGEEIVLEMKKRGPKNYIEVTRPGESHDEEEIEEVLNPEEIRFDHD